MLFEGSEHSAFNLVLSPNEILIKEESFLPEEMEFINQLLKYCKHCKNNLSGKFEGLNLSDEETARVLLDYLNKPDDSGWRLVNNIGIVTNRNLDAGEKIKRAYTCVKERRLWWNESGNCLTSETIGRSLTRVDSHMNYNASQIAADAELFSFVFSPTGMGKTTLLHQLDDICRKIQPVNRIVLFLDVSRIENQSKKTLETIGPIKKSSFMSRSFLKQFAPYIPVESFTLDSNGLIQLYILFDGLDEISSAYENTMIEILKSLAASNVEANKRGLRSRLINRKDIMEPLFLRKVILTSRPRLQDKLRLHFNTEPFSLVPFHKQEQVHYLSQGTNVSYKEAELTLESLSTAIQILTANPLIMFLLTQCILHYSSNGGKLVVLNVFDLYENYIGILYSRFFEKRGLPETKEFDRKEEEEKLLRTHLRYYYNLTFHKMHLKPYRSWISSEENINNLHLEELKQVGLISIKGTDIAPEISFWHYSFFEFFNAKILTDMTTKFSLRNAVFNHVYSSYDIEGVEEFLIGSVNLLQEEKCFDPRHLQFPPYRFHKLSLNFSSELLVEKLMIGVSVFNKIFWWIFFITHDVLERDLPVDVSHGFAMLMFANGIKVYGHIIEYSDSANEMFLIRCGKVIKLIFACSQCIAIFTYPSKSSSFFDILSLTGLNRLNCKGAACSRFFLCHLHVAGYHLGLFKRSLKTNFSKIYFCFSTVLHCILIFNFVNKSCLLKWGLYEYVLSGGIFLSGYSFGCFERLTCLFHDANKTYKIPETEVLRNFLNGNFISSVGVGKDVKSMLVPLINSKFLSVVVEEGSRLENHAVRSLLSTQDTEWIRINIFKTQKTTLSQFEADFTVKLLCSDFKSFKSNMESRDILRCLRRSRNVIAIISLYTASSVQRELIENICAETKLFVVEKLVEIESLKSSLYISDCAWWICENFTMAQLIPYFSKNSNQVKDSIGVSLSRVEMVWGDEFLFLDDVLNFNLKAATLHGSNFERNEYEFAIDKFWKEIRFRNAVMSGLTETVLKTKNWIPIMYIESRIVGELNYRDPHDLNENSELRLLYNIVEESCHLPTTFSLDTLSFFIRYGKLNSFRKHRFNIFENITKQVNIDSMCTALVVSVLVDNTSETHAFAQRLIKNVLFTNSMFKKVFSLLYNSEEFNLACLKILLSLGAIRLRNLAQKIMKNCVPPVCKIQWGSIVLHVLLDELLLDSKSVQSYYNSAPSRAFEIPTDQLQDCVENCVRDVLRKRTFSYDFSLFKNVCIKYHCEKFVRQQVVAEAMRRHKQGFSPVSGRFHALFDLYTEFDKSLNFEGIEKTHKIVFLMNSFVEYSLRSTHFNIKRLTAFIPKVKNHLKALVKIDMDNIPDLITLFVPYRSEEEWEVVFCFLFDISSVTSRESTKHVQVYREHVTPFLRVYCKTWGRDLTRKLVEDNFLWREIINITHYDYMFRKINRNPSTCLHRQSDYDSEPDFSVLGAFNSTQSPLEPILLAIEIGSLKMLSRLGRPSLLSWRNKKGETFMDISKKLLGEDNEITKFLQEKFTLRFCKR